MRNNIIQLIAEKVKGTIEESVIKVLEGDTRLDNIVDSVGKMVNNIGLDTLNAIINLILWHSKDKNAIIMH
jgi:hypothetical protein